MMERMIDTKLRDKQLICCDCSREFTFSAGEQAYFNSKQLSQPKRCHQCRRERKLRLVPDNEGKL